MTACCLTTLAVHLDIIGLMDIYLNFQLVSQRLEVNTRILDGEIETNSYSEKLWRLVTNFLFFGQFGLGFIFHMVFL
jgi:Derlin-2/3